MKKLLLTAVVTLLAFPGLMSAQTATLMDQFTQDTQGQGSCFDLKYNMSYRSRDAQTNGSVSDLQEFLLSKGYLSVDPTGYFGSMTVVAIKKFQSAVGIGNASTPGYGGTGPLTRAKIKEMTCGGTSTTTNSTDGTVNTQTVTQTSLPLGCTSTSKFSAMTGKICSTEAGLSAGARDRSVAEIFKVLAVGSLLEGVTLPVVDSDFLDGGDGVDTVSYRNNRAAYAFYRGKDVSTQGYNNLIFVKDLRNGAIDTIVNAEYLQFADQRLSVPSFTVALVPVAQPVIDVFEPHLTEISRGQFVTTLAWKVSSATRCALQSGSSEENVSVLGGKTIYPGQNSTSYRLWCVSESGTGKDGLATEKTITVSIPTATLTVNGETSLTVNTGDTINFAWNSTNGTSWFVNATASGCQEANRNGTEIKSSTANGSKGEYLESMYAGCNYTFIYKVAGSGGVATATAYVRVRGIGAIPANSTAQTATIDQGSLVNFANYPTFTGSASGLSSVIIFVYENLTRDTLLTYTTVPVVNGRWSYRAGTEKPRGSYTIQVLGSHDTLLTSAGYYAPATTPIANLEQSIIVANSGTVTFKGTAYYTNAVFVAIVGDAYNGPKDWATIYSNHSYVAFDGSIITHVINNWWTETLSGIPNGDYTVLVYDNSGSINGQVLLTTGKLTVAIPPVVNFVVGTAAHSVNLVVGQTATDGGLRITLMSITGGSSPVANFEVASTGFTPGSYSAAVGSAVGGWGGFSDTATLYGSVTVSVSSINTQSNSVTILLNAGARG